MRIRVLLFFYLFLLLVLNDFEAVSDVELIMLIIDNVHNS